MLTGRPAARAPRAMIASAHPLATQTGLMILRAGGGAVDAGLAVNAVLNVTQPPCCGFGGDAFFVYYEAASGRVHAYNASGRSPAAATVAALREQGWARMPERGPLSVTAPGAVEGWGALHERFGRLPWGELLAPAIGYAADGFPVSDRLAGWIKGASDLLRRWPDSVRAMMPGGRAPLPGERLRQPDLARTLRILAGEGPRALYEGELAREIARSLAAAGGLLTAADLAAHRGDWTEPLAADYRGRQVFVHGPNSQGWTLLALLGLLAERDSGELRPGSAEAVHLAVEAARLAYADRDAYNADPAAMTVAPARLLDPARLRARGRLIDERRAAATVAPGRLEGDTTYFAVVDAEGNALSVIQSLFKGFGSGFVAGLTGLFLQNRGSYFSLDEGHVNCLAPRRRTAHTLCAAMVCEAGRPVIVPGSMGGDGQPQIIFQLLTAMLDHGFNPQQAIELPRWIHDGQTLHLEGRFSAEVVDQLRRLGHRVERLADWDPLAGHAQVIGLDVHGLAGGADPRGDGQAAGY